MLSLIRWPVFFFFVKSLTFVCHNWPVQFVSSSVYFFCLLFCMLAYMFKIFKYYSEELNLVHILFFFLSELMILGFISLLLTIGQNYFAKICIPEKAATTMLPCKLRKKTDEEHDAGSSQRRLLWDLATNPSARRFLAAHGPNTCPEVSTFI